RRCHRRLRRRVPVSPLRRAGRDGAQPLEPARGRHRRRGAAGRRPHVPARLLLASPTRSAASLRAPPMPETKGAGGAPREEIRREPRELYRQKYEAQIREWGAKLEALSAHTDKLTAEAKLDVKPRLDALRDRLAAARERLHEVAEATDDRWDDVK